MDEEEHLVKEIKTLSDTIKRKHQALKLGISERDNYFEKTFKPIVAPLQEISSKLDKNPANVHQPLKVKTHVDYQPSLKRLKKQHVPETDRSESYDSEYEDSVESDGSAITSAQKDDNPPPTSTKEAMSNLSLIGEDIVNKGELSRKYLLKFLDDKPGSKRNYHVYGARMTDAGIMLGDSKLEIDDSDNITVAGKTYKGTPGLFELIFKNAPSKYLKRDLNMFHRICKDSNAYRRHYQKNNSIHRNKSTKFLNIISPMLSSFSSTRKKGYGMDFKSCNQSNVVYYNNLNDLVDRARFIHEAMQSGHNGLNNEWLAIMDVLKKHNIIN